MTDVDSQVKSEWQTSLCFSLCPLYKPDNLNYVIIFNVTLNTVPIDAKFFGLYGLNEKKKEKKEGKRKRKSLSLTLKP